MTRKGHKDAFWGLGMFYFFIWELAAWTGSVCDYTFMMSVLLCM